jgi:cytochrome c oxidase subunit II
MPAKHAKEAGKTSETPILDENALKMLDDHSCCGPVEPEVESGIDEPSGTRSQPEEQQPADLRTGRPEVAAVSNQQDANGANRLEKKTTLRNSRRFGFRVRLAGFLAVALLILGTALWLVRPMDLGEQMADYTIEMSMSGFTPPSLNFPAGKAITLKLVNKESPFHASGAVHQFAVDALGINEKLDAKQTRVITIPAQKAGQYTFYCDVCCGGQKSPTMRGTLTFQ